MFVFFLKLYIKEMQGNVQIILAGGMTSSCPKFHFLRQNRRTLFRQTDTNCYSTGSKISISWCKVPFWMGGQTLVGGNLSIYLISMQKHLTKLILDWDTLSTPRYKAHIRLHLLLCKSSFCPNNTNGNFFHVCKALTPSIID